MKKYAICFILLNIIFIGKVFSEEKQYCGSVNENEKFSMSNKSGLFDVKFEGIKKEDGEMASREEIMPILKKGIEGSTLCFEGHIDDKLIVVTKIIFNR